jgi:putative acetyltransferase
VHGSALEDVPGLGLAVRGTEVPGGERVVGVRVHRQPLPGVEELHEQPGVGTPARHVLRTQPGHRLGRHGVAQQATIRQPGEAELALAEDRRGRRDPVLGFALASRGLAAQRRDASAAAVEALGWSVRGKPDHRFRSYDRQCSTRYRVDMAEAPSPSAPVTVRAAAPDDVASIAELWRAGWHDAHDGRVPDALLRHRTPESYPPRVRERLAHTAVAEVHGVVAGFVVTVEDELEQLYVDAAARGTGVAQLLIAHAEQAIAARGHDEAWLAVVAGNDRAIAFYGKSGWRDAGPFDYQAEVEGGTLPVPCRRLVRQLHTR